MSLSEPSETKGPSSKLPESSVPYWGSSLGERILLTLIVFAASVVLYYGWRLTWFLTDDAFIAFRYVSNSLLGHGYVWNPPPFSPVEGYTSFLWVVLLDTVWRLFDIAPPRSANIMSLLCAFGSLMVVTFAVLRTKLSAGLSRFRLLFLFLILIGIVTNRTFLTWSSSGLETALFNLTLLSWVVVTLLGPSGKHRRHLLYMTATAALVYLSRPDGILVVISTCMLLLISLRTITKAGQFNRRWFLPILPLLIVPIHLVWRRVAYGEWLPNSYYAKHVAAWPESGIRYLASFVLEYGLWVYFLVLLYVGYLWLKRLTNRHRDGGSMRGHSEETGFMSRNRNMTAGVVIGTLLLHLAYYTFVIGGDHFEYRVYSHLIPLIFLSLLLMVSVGRFRPMTSITLFAIVILVSCPISWTHWSLTKGIESREQAHILIVPVHPSFPEGLQWYAKPFDHLQAWLIERHVCMRRQEHRLFYEWQAGRYPSRDIGETVHPGDYPVMALTMVGVPGWVFPHVNIIDQYGLNDYVVARSLPVKRPHRLMAHDRQAPPGYVEAFEPNLAISVEGRIERYPRRSVLTAQKIKDIEVYFREMVSRNRD